MLIYEKHKGLRFDDHFGVDWCVEVPNTSAQIQVHIRTVVEALKLKGPLRYPSVVLASFEAPCSLSFRGNKQFGVRDAGWASVMMLATIEYDHQHYIAYIGNATDMNSCGVQSVTSEGAWHCARVNDAQQTMMRNRMMNFTKRVTLPNTKFVLFRLPDGVVASTSSPAVFISPVICTVDELTPDAVIGVSLAQTAKRLKKQNMNTQMNLKVHQRTGLTH